MIDLYVSEMAISRHHGGGITIQRVLGDDLGSIRHFVHLRRFAQDLPPIEQCSSKSSFFLSPFETDVSRKLIGCTASARLFETEAARSWHVQRAVRQSSQLVPK